MSRRLENDLLLRACRREPTPRTPVWIMRQAGRYLPEYRAVREKYDFLTLVKTPEIAAQVTVQPVDIIGVDAAIIFSDIMVVPEAMGMALEMVESEGPRFPDPIRDASQIEALGIPDPQTDLGYVSDAIRLANEALGGRVPLIGFSGAPFTLLCYMVEGRGSRNFRYAKTLLYDAPALAHRLLDKLARAVSDYLEAQIDAGADAVQIFDTWAGILPSDRLEEYSLRYIAEIVGRLKSRGAPVIVFAKDCGYALRSVAGTSADVIGIDWKVDIAQARREIGRRAALQGNLDPVYLHASPERIREEVKKILANYGEGHGHIFNLGHGILPDVPVEHARALVQAVKEESVKYHQNIS